MSVSPLIICVIHCVLIASTLTVPMNVVASLVSKATASTAHVSALNLFSCVPYYSTLSLTWLAPVQISCNKRKLES